MNNNCIIIILTMRFKIRHLECEKMCNLILYMLTEESLMNSGSNCGVIYNIVFK